MSAVGIHEHPTLKLGLRPPKNARALRLGNVLTGVVPEHPVACDHLSKVEFTLDTNDQFGVCGPTSVDNLIRLITTALLGSPVQVTLDDVYDLYRRSGNPDFDPTRTDHVGDNGVDMQTMLEALLKDGIGGIKPLAFAKVSSTDTVEIDAATSILGGTLWGVNLETAQQNQSNGDAPQWDYVQSSPWGGHAVMNGEYNEPTGDAEVVSWKKIIKTTDPFRKQQLQEVWAIIWEWNVDHPAFQEGIDLSLLEQAFKQLTGQTFGGSGGISVGRHWSI